MSGPIPLVREAAREFVRSWPRLLAADLLFKLVALAVLTPLSSLVLRVIISTSGERVLADQDILLFILSPVGLVGLVAVGSLGLAILVLEQACMMTIAFGAAHDTRIPVLGALRHSLGNSAGILIIALRVVVAFGLMAAPFLALAAFIALRLLTEFDINFYLTERPPAFWGAAASAGLIGTLGLSMILPRVAGWAYALPLLLFGSASPRQALAESKRLAHGQRWTIGGMIAGWALATALVSTMVLGATGWVGRVMIAQAGSSVVVLVLAVGSILILWTLSNLMLTFFQAGTLAALLVAMYAGQNPSPEPRLLERLGSAPGFGRARWSPPASALLAGMAVIAGLAAGAGLLVLRGVRAEDDALIIAHRGASAAAPENTMAAVGQALDDQADMVEIDVQESADGHVVVAHDADLMKVARNPIMIWDASLEDLEGIDIGSWFGREFAEQRVPTLAQVLEASQDRAVVNIELKYYGHDQRLEERVIEVVEGLGMADQVVVMSLKYAAIQKISSLRPGWRVGLLTATAVGDLTTRDVDFLAVNTTIATRGFIRTAHARGKQVYVWTVNDPAAMWRLLNLGVDGIITDVPASARQLLEMREGLSSAERLLISAAIFLGERPPASGEEEA